MFAYTVWDFHEGVPSSMLSTVCWKTLLLTTDDVLRRVFAMIY